MGLETKQNIVGDSLAVLTEPCTVYMGQICSQ